jgi:hypothetical protein
LWAKQAMDERDAFVFSLLDIPRRAGSPMV